MAVAGSPRPNQAARQTWREEVVVGASERWGHSSEPLQHVVAEVANQRRLVSRHRRFVSHGRKAVSSKVNGRRLGPVRQTRPMPDSSDRTAAASLLQPAIVVQTSEESCTVVMRYQPTVVP